MSSEVSPEIVFALRKFNLISAEQEQDAYAEFDRAMELWHAYFELSKDAYRKEVPWWKRDFIVNGLAWRFRWMDEQNYGRNEG